MNQFTTKAREDLRQRAQLMLAQDENITVTPDTILFLLGYIDELEDLVEDTMDRLPLYKPTDDEEWGDGR